MEPIDDAKLRELLKEWQISDAPPSLDERVLGPRKPWWSFLLTGSVRIPMPAVIAIAAALLVMAAALYYERPQPPQAVTSVDLARFQPVKSLSYRVIRGQQ